MIRLFLSNNVLVLIVLPFIISFYYLLNSQFGIYEQKELLNFGFWSIFLEANSIISKSSSFVVILLNALLLNWTFNRNEFLDRNSYIVSLLYVVTMSLFKSFYSIDGILIAHLFTILMFTQFFQLNQNQDARRLVFNGCFFAGVAATFNPILIFAIPFFLTMILIIRPFVFRESFLGFTGFIIPIIYGFVHLFFQNKKNNFSLFGELREQKIQIDFLITLIVLGILFVLSILSLRSRLQKSSLRLKKQIRIIILFIWLTLIIGSLNFYYVMSTLQFSLLLIPISILLTYSFLHKNFSIIASIVFYLMILYSVIKFFILSPEQSM